jgi:phosphoserine phosphatase
MRLTLFDLDHTLLPLDSDYAWGEFTVKLGWRDAADFGRANDRFYQAYKDGTLDIHEYVRFATDAVRERGMARRGRPMSASWPRSSARP